MSPKPPEMLPPPPGGPISKPETPAPTPQPIAFPAESESPPDIIPNIMPAGQVHLLSGASGAGKTTLIAQLFSALQHGEPFFGHPTRCPAVLAYIAADRRWSDHKRWFDAAGCKPFLHYQLIGSGLTGVMIRNRVKKEGAGWLLEHLCKELFGNSSVPFDTLLIPDPMGIFYGGDINPYIPVFTHGLDLNNWALQYQSTILGPTHAGKQKGDAKQRYARPQDRIAGSTAQTATAGTAWHLATTAETETGYSELTWVPHHAPSQTAVLERNSETGLFMFAVLPAQEAAEDVGLTPARPRAQLLLPFIPFAPLDISRKELLKASGISSKTLWRHLKDLEAASRITETRFGHWARVQAIEQEPQEPHPPAGA